MMTGEHHTLNRSHDRRAVFTAAAVRFSLSKYLHKQTLIKGIQQ
jgi:hypothetical protein